MIEAQLIASLWQSLKTLFVVYVFSDCVKDAAVFAILPSVEYSMSLSNDEFISILEATDVCFPVKSSSEAIS